MGTRTEDFSTYSVEDPISGGGTWEAIFNGGIRIVDNAGTNMAFMDQGGDDVHAITVATDEFNAKQYAEVVVQDLVWAYSLLPAVRCSAASGGNCYYLYVRDWGNPASSNNQIKKLAAGAQSNLANMNGAAAAIVAGDKIGLLVDGTTISWYHNPTTYDADGFPTDGLQASTTDATLATGQPGMFSDCYSTSPGTYVSSFYAAGNTTVSTAPVITDIDTDEAVYPGQTGVVITGANFGTSGTVRLNSQADGLGIDVAQTDTSWADTSIAVTVVQGELPYGTVYAFVENDSAEENAAGFEITLSPPAGYLAIDWAGPAPDTGMTESYYELAIADLSITAAAGDQLEVVAETGLSVDGQWLPTIEPADTFTSSYRVWDATTEQWSASTSYDVLDAEIVVPSGVRRRPITRSITQSIRGG